MAGLTSPPSPNSKMYYNACRIINTCKCIEGWNKVYPLSVCRKTSPNVQIEIGRQANSGDRSPYWALLAKSQEYSNLSTTNDLPLATNAESYPSTCAFVLRSLSHSILIGTLFICTMTWQQTIYANWNFLHLHCSLGVVGQWESHAAS